MSWLKSGRPCHLNGQQIPPSHVAQTALLAKTTGSQPWSRAFCVALCKRKSLWPEIERMDGWMADEWMTRQVLKAGLPRHGFKTLKKGLTS